MTCRCGKHRVPVGQSLCDPCRLRILVGRLLVKECT